MKFGVNDHLLSHGAALMPDKYASFSVNGQVFFVFLGKLHYCVLLVCSVKTIRKNHDVLISTLSFMSHFSKVFFFWKREFYLAFGKPK